jgi:hypothetical protein
MPIDKEQYPALEQLRPFCRCDGPGLLDRVYADAQALHKRATEAEQELELYTAGIPAKTFAPKPWMDNAGRDLL